MLEAVALYERHQRMLSKEKKAPIASGQPSTSTTSTEVVPQEVAEAGVLLRNILFYYRHPSVERGGPQA